MFKAKITKIGNSTGILIPKKEMEFNNYEKDEWVEVEIKKIKK